MNTIYPYLNPWPLPRSILILDNAKIHMYPELEKLVNEKGAILIYLPPYSPQLNPIENAFALLKAWIQKHANLTFGLQPQYIISIALKECTKGTSNCAKNLFHHAGYYNNRIEYNERV
jgi:transposase